MAKGKAAVSDGKHVWFYIALVVKAAIIDKILQRFGW